MIVFYLENEKTIFYALRWQFFSIIYSSYLRFVTIIIFIFLFKDKFNGCILYERQLKHEKCIPFMLKNMISKRSL